MYITIPDITGAHGDHISATLSVRYDGLNPIWLHIVITATSVTVRKVPGDVMAGVKVDLATVKVSHDLVDATRRLFNMVGRS